MTGNFGSPRLAILVDHVAQYFAPAFRALAEHGGVQERVYCWRVSDSGHFDEGFGRHVEWNTDLYSGYSWWGSSNSGPSLLKRLRHLRADLRRFDPDVILCFGWSSPVALAGLTYGRLTCIPIFVLADANGRQPSDTVRRKLRGPIMRTLLTQVNGALSTGAANTLFYTNHGMREDRIYPGTLPIALQSFSTARDRYASVARSRKSNRPLVIGFAGKLIRIKGVDELIDAAAMLPRDGSWRLRIVGDGPEREALEGQVSRLSLEAEVEFCGFKNTDEIPDFLAGMDVVVMPSRLESRGLVAIEAMAAGAVPVVSSATGVWGEGDAVQEGITGFVYPSGEPHRLSEILLRLVSSPAVREPVARRAAAHAGNFGPEAFAERTVAAVRRETRGN